MAAPKKLTKLEAEKNRVLEVIRRFKREYPEARCSLDYTNPFELIVATILSAQCTDERVNRVTPALFKRYRNVRALAKADLSEVEDLIRTTGFFKNKAKSLVEMSQAVVERHGGSIPRTLEDLVALRGVGRKTANVVLGNAYDIPGMVVDTHVGRLSRRLGLTRLTDPEKIEQELMKLVPKEEWTLFSHLLIFHGRATCMARNPQCEECVVADLCPKCGVL